MCWWLVRERHCEVLLLFRDIFSVLEDVDSGRRSCDFFLVSAATKPPAPDVEAADGGGAPVAGPTDDDGGWMTKLVDC